MSKGAVVKREEAGALVVSEELKGSWGTEGADSADIRIPSLLLAQGLSQYVADGKAAQGDIVRSTNLEVVAKKGSPVEVIPLLSFKTWNLFKHEGGKWVWAGQEPMTGHNKDAPLEFMVDSVKHRRDRSINFYMLVVSDIAKEVLAYEKIKRGEMPEADDCVLPCLVRFTRTSFRAGQDLTTHAKKCDHFKIPMASSVFKLGSAVQKNDLGTFQVFTVERSRQSTLDELTVARKWYDTLKSASVKVHEPGEESEAPVQAAPVEGHVEDF